MIFIDTGAFIARYVTHDSHHKVALEKWQELEDKNLHFVTSNFVIDETITLLSRITENKFAAEKAKLLYTSKALVILRPTLAEELSAVSLFAKFSDQKMSFTDCVSFALMSNAKIRKAFSFGKHFQVAGFEYF
jgi:uncharacterized protein